MNARSLSIPFALLLLAAPLFDSAALAAPRPPRAAADEAFLEELTARSFRFFLEQSHPETGLVRDRARTDGTAVHDVASVAATGFGMTALCIGADRGYLPVEEASARIRRTLAFALTMRHDHGWLYHFVDAGSGARMWNCEFSTIDTALFLAGALTARGRFANDPEIVRLATALYDRVDFRYMLGGHPHLLRHGSRPETGLLNARWDTHCEHMLLYLLAIGSRTSPIPPEAWAAWRRPVVDYGAFTYVSGAEPLFIHQFSHGFVDFRGRRETFGAKVDWFANSVDATLAHRRFCRDLAPAFPGYAADMWGITASDSRTGYRAWGGPPATADLDGTVVPCAAGGSLMFAPRECLATLRAMKERHPAVWGRYGFADAFHPASGWVNPDVIGIDVGMTLVAAENLRTGAVWRWFMANPEIPAALDAAGVRRAGAGKPPHGGQ